MLNSFTVQAHQLLVAAAFLLAHAERLALLHRVTRICCDGLAASHSTPAQEVCCIKHQCNATDKFVSSDKDATEAARVDVHTLVKPFLLLYRHQLIFTWKWHAQFAEACS